MFKWHTFIFLGLLSLLSCKSSSEGGINADQSSGELSREVIVEKLKLLGDEESFTGVDVVRLFPRATIKVGGVSDEWKINESLVLHLLPGSDPAGFPITPATPDAYETRSTGVTLEVEPDLGENSELEDYSPPELDSILGEKGGDAAEATIYKGFLLIDGNGNVLYESREKR
ncbi:MAG: hypothetical protein ACSHX6_01810 [Akkermansiaceae bacterium]